MAKEKVDVVAEVELKEAPKKEASTVDALRELTEQVTKLVKEQALLAKQIELSRKAGKF
jgi:hypothetical protein